MKTILLFLIHLGDKLGALGAVISVLACPFCFPALATVSAALGLGFLSQWEGVFVTVWLPVFAWIILVSNGLSWFRHHKWYRMLIGMIGPVLLLYSLYIQWNVILIYFSLAVIVLVAIVDLILSKKICKKASSCCQPK